MLHPAILDLVRKLEGTIGKMYLFCSITSQTLSEKGEILPDCTLTEVLFNDLVTYSIHLSAADGALSDAETECIKRLFNLKWSKEKIEQYAAASALGTEAFSESPKILQFFAKADQIEIEEDGSIETYSCEFLFDCFKAIGSLFIWCDGCSSESKKSTMAAYLANLKGHINAVFPALQLEE